MFLHRLNYTYALAYCAYCTYYEGIVSAFSSYIYPITPPYLRSIFISAIGMSVVVAIAAVCNNDLENALYSRTFRSDGY